MFHPVLKVKVYNEELVFGPGLVILLEYMRQTESMKEACAMMEMSYSKGWKIVNRAERELGYDLIERRHGGKSGGRCAVTEQGISLIERYRKLEADVKRELQERFENYFPEYCESR